MIDIKFSRSAPEPPDWNYRAAVLPSCDAKVTRLHKASGVGLKTDCRPSPVFYVEDSECAAWLELRFNTSVAAIFSERG
jgi:hypothetical protein